MKLEWSVKDSMPKKEENMRRISRRHFLKAGTAGFSTLALTGFLPAQLPKSADAYEYTPPANLPYSKERDVANENIAKSPGPQVLKLREGVYIATGYALTNMIMIETKEGLVIVDTTETLSGAQQVMAEFRKATDKPVKYVIYTHNHGDHFRGTKACYGDGVKVIAHSRFMEEVKLQEARGMSGMMRAGAMFAINQPWKDRNSMVFDYPTPYKSQLNWELLNPADLIWPTDTFTDKYTIRLGGITFELIHAPGETPDQIIVGIPEYKVACCADNFYASFPNLYTIRGTSNRPALDWAAAQDKALAFEPHILLPGHGLPIEGRETIKTVLTNYRDAIRHVHDQTLKAVSEFLPPEAAIRMAALPPNLANLPYLRQRYGYIPYCVRSIYEAYVGWFDGNPVNLSPLTHKELGVELLAIAGSADGILAQVEKAQKAGRLQAALELCEMVLENDPGNRAARLMKITSLLGLSIQTENFPTANYYKVFAGIERMKIW
jgi:alkyl sulfatase BDS1-like metallo-beta-lactamase superfamily hydrolase